MLIIGAAGGVGSLAVQVARAFGAEVTGVCSTTKVDLVRSIGADHVIDYSREDFTDGKRRWDVIVDTAGRLHTKHNLMAELEKMTRIAKREVADAPQEVLLVLDATTGQNGLTQAREFTKSAGVTGLVLTKLDGTAKGGVVTAIAKELKLPIRFVGTGEKIDDLIEFSPDDFVESLFPS